MSAESKRQRRRRCFWLADGLCHYCGVFTPLETGTIDHVIPRSKGGANALTNLVWSCFPCNQDKGDQLLEGTADAGHRPNY